MRRASLVSGTVIQMVAPATVWLKDPVGCTAQPTASAAAADARAAKRTGTARMERARLNALCFAKLGLACWIFGFRIQKVIICLTLAVEL